MEGDDPALVQASAQGAPLDGDVRVVELRAIDRVVDADNLRVSDGAEDGVIGLLKHGREIEPLDLSGPECGRAKEEADGCELA